MQTAGEAVIHGKPPSNRLQRLYVGGAELRHRLFRDSRQCGTDTERMEQWKELFRFYRYAVQMRSLL